MANAARHEHRLVCEWIWSPSAPRLDHPGVGEVLLTATYALLVALCEDSGPVSHVVWPSTTLMIGKRMRVRLQRAVRLCSSVKIGSVRCWRLVQCV